jgi:PhoH-like ATPase
MADCKNYVVDTNVLLDDPDALLKLRNGNENRVFIPYHVLLELNKFKKNPKLGHLVSRVIGHLSTMSDQFTVLKADAVAEPYDSLVDRFILDEIAGSGITEPILVTNDRVFQLQASIRGIRSETYRDSAPAKAEAEQFTGFLEEGQETVLNSFRWNETGKPVFCSVSGDRIIDFQHRVWNVAPRNVYQNLAIELMVSPDIHVASFQSAAGYGKSFLALASALYLVFERKTHEKIYLVKPTIEIGQKLGYLPGKLEEKLEPYTRYISELVYKLHRLRPANRLFLETGEFPPRYNPKRFEILPLGYIRGMNIENAVVIVDEMQNLSRPECRALLSRMGEGVKCFCLGDIHQVDNPYLNFENNGLNWVVNKFKGSRIYGHLLLKGDKSRGPITDLVIRSGL